MTRQRSNSAPPRLPTQETAVLQSEAGSSNWRQDATNSQQTTTSLRNLDLRSINSYSHPLSSHEQNDDFDEILDLYDQRETDEDATNSQQTTTNSRNLDLSPINSDSHPPLSHEQNDDFDEILNIHDQRETDEEQNDENNEERYKTNENALEKPLRKPDRLRLNQAQVTTTEGKEETISKEQNFKITDTEEDETSYIIQYYKWNSNNSEPRQRLEEIQGRIEKDNVVKGSRQQTPLENINTGRRNRPVQILPNNVRGIRQEDVYQNGVSDCYLQAAMIAVAKQNPQQIWDMVSVNDNDVRVTFHLPENNENNASNLNQELRPIEITVKKSLLLNNDGQLVYGGKIGNNNYLWPAFIQKAWAVVKGGYAESAMGVVTDTIKAITGEGRSTPFRLTHHWNIYNNLVTALNDRRAAVLTTSVFAKQGKLKKLLNSFNDRSAPKDKPLGKVRVMHAYAVLDMDNRNLTENDFQDNAIPDVSLTLRDPRDPKGKTFKRTLKQVLSKDKFDAVHTG
ncbi:hypothetical protein WA1_19860 [Scytonema hofmannii PCC 7110]|uniref:Calpain catalytic domain-containing protein n=1 Tax=Scytonema hofmannii PCC 7110 TaxID=128403 RepID=A0A139XC15_9CYAN|nr:C2 family cysteine protease [Scytonema hofmannii]KYC42238.1 hypothetical protein WA1_19860 [Scytonema hofmannii PCC 7110]